MTDVIENINNEAVESQVDNSVEANEVIETPEAVNDASELEQQEDNSVEADEEVNKPKDAEWPKKAVNALANAKKQAAKLREKNEALARELEELRAVATNSQKFDLSEPQENDFETYSDYIKAHAKWSVKQELSEFQNSQVKDKIKNLEQQHVNGYIKEREVYAEAKAAEFAQQNPDFVEVIKATQHIPLSHELDMAFLSIDDPQIAYYNLAKEGKLENLPYMPIEMARAEIVQAQYRQPKSVQKKQVSAAPEPLKSVKGTASSKKPLHQQSPKELLKWIES